MATYYVGPGGSDSNNGLTYATRKLTLNGAEDIPVAAGDIVYVAPGTYREELVCDVSGSSGSPITYIGDVTGAYTDGVGGRGRLTGFNSDASATATRPNVLDPSTRSYRTFRGFAIDGSSGNTIRAVDADYLILEDCVIQGGGQTSFSEGVQLNSSAGVIIRRCKFKLTYGNGSALRVTGTSNEDVSTLIENCIFEGADGAYSQQGCIGVTMRHCTLNGGRYGIETGTGEAGMLTVEYCIITGFERGFTSGTAGYIVENYNSVFGCQTARTNTSTGANSVARAPLWQDDTLLAGYQLPAKSYFLGGESDMIRKGGHADTDDDYYGRARPATDSKKSWGAVQYNGISRNTVTVRTGGASLKIDDAGRWQSDPIPVSAVSTTISVWVRWESDYAGTKPQLIVRQPGQADQTATATGSAGSWEQLSVTFTPAAQPGWVCVEVVSHNTAVSGSYAVYVDDLAKS
jgi:hypothetical protein